MILVRVSNNKYYSTIKKNPHIYKATLHKSIKPSLIYNKQQLKCAFQPKHHQTHSKCEHSIQYVITKKKVNGVMGYI